MLQGQCNGPVSVRLSVSHIYRPLQHRAAAAPVGLLLGARRTGNIDLNCAARAIDARRAGAQQQWCRSTALSSKCGQHHVDSLRRRLNTDLCLIELLVGLTNEKLSSLVIFCKTTSHSKRLLFLDRFVRTIYRFRMTKVSIHRR